MTSLLTAAISNAIVVFVVGCVLLPASRLRAMQLRPALRHALWLLLLVKLVTPTLFEWPVLNGSRTIQWLCGVPSHAETAVIASNVEIAMPSGGTGHFDVERIPLPKANTIGQAKSDGGMSDSEVNRAPNVPPIELDHSVRKPSAPLSLAAGQRSGMGWLALAVGIGLGGAIFIWLRLLWQWLAVRRVLRFASNADEGLNSVLQDVCGEMGCRRIPRLCVATVNFSPMLWVDWQGATIVLPKRLIARLSDQQLRLVLGHEVAHYCRRDHWANLFSVLVTSLFWWHPIAWYARRELRVAQELCCDAMVLGRFLRSRQQYARALLETLDFMSAECASLPALVSGFGERLSLQRRFEMLAHPKLTHRFTWWCWPCLLVAVGVMPLGILAAQEATGGAEVAKPGAGTSDGQSAAADPRRKVDLEEIRFNIEKYKKMLSIVEAEQQAQPAGPSVQSSESATRSTTGAFDDSEERGVLRIKLQHARADDVAEAVRQLLSAFQPTDKSSVVAIKSTNTLVLHGKQGVFPAIEDLVAGLDQSVIDKSGQLGGAGSSKFLNDQVPDVLSLSVAFVTAQEALSAAEARHERLKNGDKSIGLEAAAEVERKRKTLQSLRMIAQAVLLSARADHKLACTEVERTSGLERKGFATVDEVRRAKAAVDVVSARINLVQQLLAGEKEPLPPERPTPSTLRKDATKADAAALETGEKGPGRVSGSADDSNEAGELQIQVRHARAVDVAEAIRKLLSAFQPTRKSSVDAAPRTNTLVLRGDRRILGGIEKVLASLDVNGEIMKVQGRVLAPDGLPVKGASIWLCPSSEGVQRKGQTAPRVWATTGDDGHFVFDIQSNALGVATWMDVAIVATADGFGPGFATCTQTGFSDGILQLAIDDVAIEGRLIDLQGKGVAGAGVMVGEIEVIPEGDWARHRKAIQEGQTFTRIRLAGPLPGKPEAYLTDEQGRFQITGVGRDRLAVLKVTGSDIQHSNIRVLTQRGFAGASGVYGANLVHAAAPSRLIIGTVTDDVTGKPIAGIRVRGLGSINEVVTDKKGEFALRGCPKGEKYTLYALPPTSDVYFATTIVADDRPGLEPIQVELKLHPGIPVHGRIVERGTMKPVQGTIDYYPLHPNPFVKRLPGGELAGEFIPARATTQPDGTFRCVALPGPGALCVTAERANFRPAVIDPKAFFNAPADSWLYGDKNNLRIAIGGDAVTAASTEHYQAIALLDLPEKGGPVEQEIALVPAIPLGVKVLNPDGKALTGVEIMGLKSNSDRWTEVVAQNGFALSGLDPDRPRRIAVRHVRDQLIGHLLVSDPGTSEVIARLQPWATLAGRLLDADGKSLDGISIHTPGGRDQDGMMFGSVPIGSIRSERDGTFRVESLIPGLEYSIHFREMRPNARQGVIAKNITLRPGEVKNLGEVRISGESVAIRP